MLECVQPERLPHTSDSERFFDGDRHTMQGSERTPVRSGMIALLRSCHRLFSQERRDRIQFRIQIVNAANHHLRQLDR
jgi:hypothetical protein